MIDGRHTDVMRESKGKVGAFTNFALSLAKKCLSLNDPQGRCGWPSGQSCDIASDKPAVPKTDQYPGGLPPNVP